MSASMREGIVDVTQRLARDAEAVCRHYLSNGMRSGRYWLVGDTDNSPGRSLFVRLVGPDRGEGAAGKWTDAATGKHGDLLDLIAACRHLSGFAETLDEARAFLRLPRPDPDRRTSKAMVPGGSPEAARRLWRMSRSLGGSLAERYLHHRGLIDLRDCPSLRFHPHCWYRGDPKVVGDRRRNAWPAMIARVSDLSGAQTGLHRTWLDPGGLDKAAIATPRRAMGHLLGSGVRFGQCMDVLAVGEGLETTLSLRQAAPGMPVVAALSANHLAALVLPTDLRRLYLVRDNDAAGRWAVDALFARAAQQGVAPIILDARSGDLNDDLRSLGLSWLRASLARRFAPQDLAALVAD